MPRKNKLKKPPQQEPAPPPSPKELTALFLARLRDEYARLQEDLSSLTNLPPDTDFQGRAAQIRKLKTRLSRLSLSMVDMEDVERDLIEPILPLDSADRADSLPSLIAAAYQNDMADDFIKLCKKYSARCKRGIDPNQGRELIFSYIKQIAKRHTWQ